MSPGHSPHTVLSSPLRHGTRSQPLSCLPISHSPLAAQASPGSDPGPPGLYSRPVHVRSKAWIAPDSHPDNSFPALRIAHSSPDHSRDPGRSPPRSARHLPGSARYLRHRLPAHHHTARPGPDIPEAPDPPPGNFLRLSAPPAALLFFSPRCDPSPCPSIHDTILSETLYECADLQLISLYNDSLSKTIISKAAPYHSFFISEFFNFHDLPMHLSPLSYGPGHLLYAGH